MFELHASQLLGWSDDRPVTWGELRGPGGGALPPSG